MFNKKYHKRISKTIILDIYIKNFQMGKFLITEDEKARILSLYSAFINEQELIRIYSKKEDKNPSNEKRAAIERYFENRGIVKKLIKGEDQLAIWNEMVADPKQKPFIADIVRHIESHINLIDGLLLRKGTEEIKKESPNEQPGLTVSLDENAKTNFYFRDNEWELTDEGKADIQNTIFAQVDANIKENAGFNKCVDSLIINSSASRFRNTGDAEKYSFAQLSKLRNDSVRDFIMQRLNEMGITLWCSTQNNIQQNINGDNGDGTSGPNPPKPLPFIPKGQSSMKPSSTDETKRNEFGEPLETKVEYDVYKYTKPSLTIAFAMEKSIDKPPAEGVNIAYDVEFFKGKTKTGKISGRKNAKITKFGIPKTKLFAKMIECPVFNK